MTRTNPLFKNKNTPVRSTYPPLKEPLLKTPDPILRKPLRKRKPLENRLLRRDPDAIGTLSGLSLTGTLLPIKNPPLKVRNTLNGSLPNRELYMNMQDPKKRYLERRCLLISIITNIIISVIVIILLVALVLILKFLV